MWPPAPEKRCPAATAKYASRRRNRATARRRKMEIETVRVMPGQIAADHQHHAEFAQSMGEAQDHAGDDAGDGERHHHAEKGGGARDAQAPGGFDQLAVHRREAGCKGLHGERQAIENGSHQQPLKREWQHAAGERRVQAARRTVRADGQQDIEPQDGGRQHQRQRDHGFHQELPAARRERQPMRGGQPDGQQDQRGQTRIAAGSARSLANPSTPPILPRIHIASE